MNPSLVSYLSDAARLLSDVHYNISITRRAFITPNVNRLVEDVITDQPIESLLFGEKLPDLLKAAKELEKDSKAIVKPLQLNKSFSNHRNTGDKYFTRPQTSSNASRYSGQFPHVKKHLNFKSPSGAMRRNNRSRQDQKARTRH
ncbi:uncharacterized protein LOC122501039 [Leptopilina heterotoma]|uniref:uncharacterized protein LOC122501039 n=1 Tax=Leptopilina heterotoma TaxID=63436 RepID=UPI001CAA3A04|nr:uncharacterized protein LOC122501039 [Leptopilina heterotoma]